MKLVLIVIVITTESENIERNTELCGVIFKTR